MRQSEVIVTHYVVTGELEMKTVIFAINLFVRHVRDLSNWIVLDEKSMLP